MAIYSLNLASIGRTTHAAGTAGAHMRYIGRPDAQPALVAEHMPTDPTEARTWMDQAERADRKNARVIDKVRIALPRELTPEERMQLVQDFAADLTKGRVPWYAAIHASGKDAHNPHCHLVIRDRDIETGKRVVRLSDSARDRTKAGLEPKAVEWVRSKWEDHANRALERAGHDARIDRRSLEAQGIDREPTIHIGPQAQHIDKRVNHPESKIVTTGNGRVIDYPMIDAGRTRQERHAEIVDFNLEKDARSPDFRTRETAKFQRDQMAKDRALENQLIADARRRTLEERRYRSRIRAELDDVRALHRDEGRAMRQMLRDDWTTKRSSLTVRHQAERSALDLSQGKFSARFMRLVDITGRTRKRQDGDQATLQARHKAERGELVLAHRENRSLHSGAVRSRYADMKREVAARYRPGLLTMRDRHHAADEDADQERQKRAAERDQDQQRFEDKLRQVERMQRDRRRNRGLAR
ncbi:MAG: MobA/MobL family protein [Pseudomonadota bacterium]